MKTVRYYLIPVFLLALVTLADRCRAADTACGTFPGMRACTDADFNPYAALKRKFPLFAEAIRSVGHVCDHVTRAYLDKVPGAEYYHVTCDDELHYTIGVSAKRSVVWAGDFRGY